MKLLYSRLSAFVLALLLGGSANAHHSFAMFDNTRETWVEGTIVEFQWANPHTWIQIAVRGNQGSEAVEWSLEGGSPNLLARNGWKRTVLKPGDKVRILVYPLKSGKPGGSFLEVHKEDGSVYYYHG